MEMRAWGERRRFAELLEEAISHFGVISDLALDSFNDTAIAKDDQIELAVGTGSAKDFISTHHLFVVFEAFTLEANTPLVVTVRDSSVLQSQRI